MKDGTSGRPSPTGLLFADGRGWNPAPTDLLFINGLTYTQSRALSFRSESEESHIGSGCVVMRFFANQRFALNDSIIVCG